MRKLLSSFSIATAVVLATAAFVSISSAHAATSEAKFSIGTKGDQLAFDKAKLTAKKGQTIKLTFSNKAAKDSGMQHNWVLVNPGKSDEVGQAGMAAGADKNYVPDSPDVLAKTKLAAPGETVTVEFKAPEKAGEYPYVCTFPGHYAVMKGMLVVK
ncbi:MAG: cupredoxin domain-containing protein [Bdellovibrionales bacterium]|nr:cupredoxin domain-containing protein [Bdellovibrionales bacterium]